MDPAKLEAIEFTDDMTDQNTRAANEVEKITKFLRQVIGKYLTIEGRGMCAAPALQGLYAGCAQLEQAVLQMRGPQQVQPAAGVLPRRMAN